MLADLSGQVALVTAGSRGLGSEIVRDFTRCGAKVAFTYLENHETAEALAKDINEAGDQQRCLAIQANANDFERAHAVVSEVAEKFGAPGILVCSAGIARGGAVWELSEADWDDVIAVSLKGVFNYIHAVAPLMIEASGGKIVVVGSINGLRGRMGSASYNAAKAGLVGLIKTAASEMGRHNVNVNMIAPGFIETTTQVGVPQLIRDLVLKECAIKRLGAPEDIVPLITFLCSEHARHITGQTIKIDAGQYL